MDTVWLQDSYHVGQNSVTPKSSKPAAQTSVCLCLSQSRVNTCDGLTVQPSCNGLAGLYLLWIIDRIDKRAPLWCLSNHCELPAVIIWSSCSGKAELQHHELNRALCAQPKRRGHVKLSIICWVLFNNFTVCGCLGVSRDVSVRF